MKGDLSHIRGEPYPVAFTYFKRGAMTRLIYRPYFVVRGSLPQLKWSEIFFFWREGGLKYL